MCFSRYFLLKTYILFSFSAFCCFFNVGFIIIQKFDLVQKFISNYCLHVITTYKSIVYDCVLVFNVLNIATTKQQTSAMLKSYLCYVFTIESLYITVLSSKPNIIVLYIENIQKIREKLVNDKDLMPNFHNLINSSVEFSNVYGERSSASNFASLFTGKPAVDLGIIQGKLLPFDYFPSLASTGGLNTNEITIPKYLKQHGFVTWFTGFWQLGLGKRGLDFPTSHGFDTWMGVAHPHNEWCHRNKDGILSSGHASTHPYMKLLYKTSFIWMLVLLLLTTAVWFRIISVKLYVNLLIYTICASVAFYILLQLFIIQRSASCVLFYHNEPFQQPYEMKNLTLHLTRHISTLMEVSNDANKPFFTILNYLKMKEPVFHADVFRTKATNSFASSLLELDWSIGVIVNKLHELDIYDNTVIFVTGGSSCNTEQSKYTANKVPYKVFQRKSASNYVLLLDYDKTNWSECLKVPLYIKDVLLQSNTQHVDKIVSISEVYQTIVDISENTIQSRNNQGLRKFYKSIGHDEFEDYMYSVVLKNGILNDFDLNIENNTSLYNFDDVEEVTSSLQWVIESTDDEVEIEALVAKEFDQNETSHVSKINEAIFHYYNIYKPVMVTYQEKYQIIFSYIDGDGYLQSLVSPVIIDIHKELKSLNKTLLSSTLEEVYQNVSTLLKIHTVERQNKNPWTSQFEMPVYPWLLPCSNFPLCKTQRLDNDDFTDILTIDHTAKESFS